MSKMLVSTRFNLRNVVNIAKNVFHGVTSPNRQTPLGRWKICETKNIDLVVDYANEDNCGSCSQYSTNVDAKVENQLNQKKYSTADLYVYDYECLLTNHNN